MVEDTLQSKEAYGKDLVVTPERDHLHFGRLPAKLYTIAPANLELYYSEIAVGYEDAFLHHLEGMSRHDIRRITTPGNLDLVFFCFDFSSFPEVVRCSSNGWKYNGTLLLPSRRTFNLREEKSEGRNEEAEEAGKKFSVNRDKTQVPSIFETFLLGYERLLAEVYVKTIKPDFLHIIREENTPEFKNWYDTNFKGKLIFSK